MSTTTTAGPPPGAGLPSGQIDLRGRARPAETVIKTLLAGSALLSIAIIVRHRDRAGPARARLPERTCRIGDFFATEGEFAVLPLLSGTLVVTAIALFVAVPLGLGAAMYLSEYASPRARKILKPTVELLAGVPSVVYGFFAVAFVTPTLLQKILNLEVNFTNALAAGVVLGVMIVPTIASLSEDAMSAVPQAMRQGSLAMGANRMQTTLRVVFPAALSGIAAAIVLGMSRAIGETMIVALAAGSQPNLSLDIREGMQTMTGKMASLAGGENAVGSSVVQLPVRHRSAALRGHPGDQHRQHRAGPTLQAGLLMAIATRTAREVTTAIATGRNKDRNPASMIFLAALWFSLFFGVMVLLVLIVSTALRRLVTIRRQPAHGLRLHAPSRGIPASGPASSAHCGSWSAPPSWRSRSASPPRSTSRSSRTAETWYNRFIEVNIQNLAAVPSIVYGLLAVAALALIGFTETGVVLGGAVALALLILPVIIITTREAVRCGASGYPPGIARARRHRVADHLAADPAVGRARHRDRAPSSGCRGRSVRRHRC